MSSLISGFMATGGKAATGASASSMTAGDTMSGGIDRTNPYPGTDATSTQSAAIKGMQNFQNAQQNAKTTTPGNTYGALFGTQNMSQPMPGAASAQPLQSAQPMPAPPASAQPMPAPPAPIQIPVPQVAPAPMPTVSDVRAKYKIEKAQGELDEFLQKVYENVISKRNS